MLLLSLVVTHLTLIKLYLHSIRSISSIRSIHPTRSISSIRSIHPTRSIRSISSIHPTRSIPFSTTLKKHPRKMDSSEESDYHSEHHYSPVNHDIDIFISEHLDDILDIFYDFRERFSWCPYFLAHLQCTHLTDFFTDILFHPQNFKSRRLTRTQIELYDRFIREYESELHTSLSIADGFLSKFKRNLLPLDWALFCFSFSDLGEVSRPGFSLSSGGFSTETIDSHQEDIS